MLQFGGAGRITFEDRRYPEDVGTDEVPNYIVFNPQKVEFSKIENYGGDFARTIDFSNKAGSFQFPGLSNFTSQLDGFVENLANNANNLLGNLTNGLAGVKFNIPKISSTVNGSIGKIISGSFNIGALELSLGMSQNPATKTTMGSISMYMPPQLASNLTANYKEEALGATGAAAADFIRERGYTSAAGIANGITEKMIPAVLSDLSKSTFKSPFAVATGRVSNQFSYAIFNGMKHRSFNYSFNMVAKNERESKEIKRICDLFMFNMLPEKTPNSNFHFLEIPNQWEISYMRQGNRIDYLDSPNACFLTDVKITYGANTGMALHTDGAPIDVTLALTFMEIEPLFRPTRGRELSNIELGYRGIGTPPYYDNNETGPQ